MYNVNPYGFTGVSGISQNFPSSINYGFSPTGAGLWQGLINPAFSSVNPSLIGINQTPGFQSSINPAATGFQSSYNPGLSWGGINQQGVSFASSGLAQPRVDLSETNSDVVIAAELPNINPNQLNLTVTDDSVTISASTAGIPGMTATSIYRTVSLPTNVRAEHCSASYSNGILEVRCPKADLTARRRIQVTS
ncbi:MAG: Hsp20/alpha crystallin family protein [Thermacetogeniaceae bacterium]